MTSRLFKLSCCLVFTTGVLAAYECEYEQPIVVIIPSYNNEQYYKMNLDSVFDQKYGNVKKIIYINDASTDNTGVLVENYVYACGMDHKVTIIHNEYNRKALMNIYNAVHMCDDNDLVVILDGDDRFAHDYVLAKFNRVHADGDTWLSYAQYINWPPMAAVHNKIPILGYAAQTPQEIIDSKNYRWCYKWFWSGLRGFRAWFFKCVKIESLFLDTPPHLGKLLPIMYDAAILWPMMEMGGTHTAFIPNILLMRTMTPLNDFHSSGDEVKKAVRRVLRTQKVYPTIDDAADSATVHGRQDNRGAAVVIVSDNNPEAAAHALELMMHHCPGAKSRCVVYRATQANHDRYQWLATHYSDVTFLREGSGDALSEQLCCYLEGLDECHVVITSDKQCLKKSIDVSACIDQLERTYAHALYFGLGIDDFAAQPTQQPIAARACERLDGDLYAWQFKCWVPHNWQQHSLAPTLYRVFDVLTALKKVEAPTLDQLMVAWQKVVVPQDKVGLFFAHACAMVSSD